MIEELQSRVKVLERRVIWCGIILCIHVIGFGAIAMVLVAK